MNVKKIDCAYSLALELKTLLNITHTINVTKDIWHFTIMDVFCSNMPGINNKCHQTGLFGVN